MKLSKLIVPTALIAGIAFFAPHANAQTMGEYAGTTAGVGTGAGSMGTSMAPPSFGTDNGGGGSGTWGANGLGASFEERAGAASSSGGSQGFDSRAGAMSGESDQQSRWPQSQLDANSSDDASGSDRFGPSDRFSSDDRFNEQSALSSSEDRFPPSEFSNNGGLDTSHSSSSGLDTSYSSN